jgi:hypothetical protein
VKRKVKYQKRGLLTYSHFHEMFADPVKPLSQDKQVSYLIKIYEGLDALDNMTHPEDHHWQNVADAVNMLTTLVTDMAVMEDPDGVIRDATKTLHGAWKREQSLGYNTLDELEVEALRTAVAEYAEVMETLPERAMVRCHRLTEKRMQEILNGKRREGDLVI